MTGDGTITDDVGDAIDDGDLSAASLPALAMFINNRHAEALAGQQTALVAAWRAGNGLLAAKAQCKHGEFMGWIKANFNDSYSTAAAYMRLAKLQRAETLDKHTSIRQALEAVCGSDPQTPTTRNPFLRPFYGDMTQMASAGLSVKGMAASNKWPEHQHEVFTAHGDWVQWNVRILADVLNVLLAEEPPTGPTEGEKAQRAETLETLEALRDAISKFLIGAGVTEKETHHAG